MTPGVERWHQVSELFDRIADLAPAERERILAAECADDPALRAEVERLLQADGLTNPLDHDIAGQASVLLLEGDPERHHGQLFGPYRIVRLLGQGGMGRVYLAERQGEDFAQTVALKLVGGLGSFDAALARRRFVEERRLLARLEHPHIARLLDGGVGPEAQPWFAMEYVDGAPLTEWCDARTLGIDARLTLFAKVCDAVDHAHRFLIVHRDLKPGNLLVDVRGEPKVLDFGIAKMLEEGPQASEASTVMMTPHYAAPEQIRGGQISTATDVYALGAVLFELLTGRRAFPDPLAPREPPLASRAVTEDRASLTQRAAACSTTPRALRKLLRRDLDRIVRTALDPEPARRYGSAARLAEDLRAVVAGQPISLRSDRTYRLGVFLRRHKFGVAAASVAVLALLGTTGWALWQTQQAVHQASLARQEALASESVSELLVSAFDAADPSTRESLAEPTAKDVLDASAASVTEELAETPALRARVQMLLGRAYYNLGYPDKAATLLDASIAGFQSNHVNRLDQAIDAMTILAEVEIDRELRERSVELARRILDLRKRNGASPKELADAYGTLGVTLIGTARYEEAKRTLETAHALIAQVYGDPSSDLAWSLNNRGALASSSGEVREAERLFRASLAMKSRVKDTPGSLYATRGLLAIALRRQGRLDEAERELLRNLKLAPSLYPNDSIRRATLEQRLADVYWNKGDLVRAQSTFEMSIATSARASGPRSVDTAIRMVQLAEVLEARGNIKDAERNYRLAVELYEVLPSVPENTKLRANGLYGMFLIRQGINGPARDRLESTLARWIAISGQTSGNTPWDLAAARLLDAEYRIANGRQDSVESALPSFGPDQPLQEARRHHLLSRARASRGDRPGAANAIERAIGMVDGIAGKESALAALWRIDYADLLVSAGMPEQARLQLNLAEPTLMKQMVPAAPSLSRLAQLRDTIEGIR